MTETQLFNAVGIETEPLEVVFITNQAKVPEKIGQMLNGEGRSWEKVTVDRFLNAFDHLGDIGTAIVDTSEVESADREAFIAALKKLEKDNTAAILVNDNIDFPFDELPLASLLKSASFDELWGRIDANISYRKTIKAQADEKLEQAVFPKGDLHPRHSEDMIEQLKMAGRVQRDFLPKTMPNTKQVRWATFFAPAEWVSGDIYDVTRLDEQHIGFYVADAVGHSMPAALLTMFLKQALVMRKTKGSDYKIFVPADVMTTLNNKMSDQNISGCLFATCCYGLLNIRTMQMTYCRAGHPYPILIRNGEQPIQLQAQGGLLGVFADSKFEQETIQLNKGDKLVIYSDGLDSIIGNTDSNGNINFKDSFRQLLEMDADSMMEGLSELVKQSGQKFPDIDDRTAIAMEVL